MKELRALRKYFVKYWIRLIVGIAFIVLSNYFGILSPQITGYIFNLVQQQLSGGEIISQERNYDPLVNLLINKAEIWTSNPATVITLAGITILILALLRGVFMFFMRQTIIVMSRHIEYDQKNEIYAHYQTLDVNFYKTNATGDLMSRIAEDVSRVRMYTGPAIMYLINLIVLISLSIFYMLKQNIILTLYVLAPLPLLAIIIYVVNNIINKKSEKLQGYLAALTTNAQESYAGIRVIKSFGQEDNMQLLFNNNSERYRQQAVSLAKVEGLYFPSIALLIGLSTLLTIMIGGIYAINHQISIGTIVEFVVYINMLTFPVSAIGWVASMIQRAAASQKRINEFLDLTPAIQNIEHPISLSNAARVSFEEVSYTYPHTGIKAIKKLNFTINPGEKIAIIGRTGCGKTTLAQLILRLFDPQEGRVTINGIDVKTIDLKLLREQIAYVPQDVFLFSDTIANNIRFGKWEAQQQEIENAAIQSEVHTDICSFPKGYETIIGERGVTLSGGQKQRISIARALLKSPQFLILDDCLSAVDARTERAIIHHLTDYLSGKTAIIITHRIFSLFEFDKIIVLHEGEIVEMGNHQSLLEKEGFYFDLYQQQMAEEAKEEGY